MERPSSRCSRSRREGAFRSDDIDACELSSRSAGATSCVTAVCGVARDDEQRTLAGIRQIQSSLKNPHRERIVAYGFRPEAIFRLQIEQMPASAAERE